MGFRVYLILALLISAIYLGFKIVPPYVSNYEFKDEVRAAGRNANAYTYNSNDDKIRADVIKRARGCDVSLVPDQIDVDRGSDGVRIRVNYDVPIDIPFKPFTLHFAADSLEGA